MKQKQKPTRLNKKDRRVTIGQETYKLRTRVRLSTITELISSTGKVLALGVASIKPGEEDTMNFSTGAELSGHRAVDDFFSKARLAFKERNLPPLTTSRIPQLLVLDSFNRDREKAYWQVSRGLNP